MDQLVSLFYTQALHELCDSADMDYPDHRLPVPVRFLLDDFATNARIPDFQNIISVIRSREIYVSIILQSITQLNALYLHHLDCQRRNFINSLSTIPGADQRTNPSPPAPAFLPPGDKSNTSSAYRSLCL